MAGLVLALGVAETIDGTLDSAAATAGEPTLSPLCPAASPAREDSVDRLGPREARDAAPAAAVAPSVRTFDRSAFTPVEPSLREAGTSNELAITGSLGTGALAAAPAGGFELDGALCMVPMQTTLDETAATLVNGDAALYANSAPDTDTIVRPTATGVTVVESLRGAQAPTSFSWKLGVPQGDGLRALASGGVAIEDPAHDAPATHARPKRPASLERTGAIPDSAAQLAESRYEIARAERETGSRVVGVVSPPYAVDSRGNAEAAALRVSDDGTLTVSSPPGSTAVVLNAAAKLGTGTAAKPVPPQPVNSYPLIALTANLSTEAANAGCSFAQAQPQGQRLLLLNFGQARVEAGVFGAGRKPFYPNADILSALSSAATSYRQDGCHVEGTSATIAYGTGNYKLSTTGNDGDPMTPQLAKATGAAQLATAQQLRDSVSPEDGVAVAGDIEPGWDLSPAGLDAAKSLARGADTGDLTYYNFGTAGHCPPYSGFDPGCGAWKFKDLGDLSQKHQAVPLPEIYRPDQAVQWATVRKKWDGHRARKCARHHKPSCYTFAGATSEPKPCGAELSPAQSWKKLWKANPLGSVGNELIYYNPQQVNC